MILKLVDEQEKQAPHHGAEREAMNLRSVQGRITDDRRQAVRDGCSDRRSGADLQFDCSGSMVQGVEKSHRPIITHKEQFARLYDMQDCYFGVRVTRARCKAAIKLLDVIFSFDDAPPLPLNECMEKCTCQYQGVRNRRCGPRRLGPPDRRKTVREGESVRRTVQGRRNDDSGFHFYARKK